jgi:hypothetical protein
MQLQVGDQRVGIHFNSLMWFLVFTAIGTVAGAVIYNYLQPLLPPALRGSGGLQPLPPSTPVPAQNTPNMPLLGRLY